MGKSLESLITASDIKFPQPVGKSESGESPKLIAEFFCIPWTHHRYIIDKIDGNAAKVLFYVHQAFQHGWSRAVLLNWLDTDLYDRQGKAINEQMNTPVEKPSVGLLVCKEMDRILVQYSLDIVNQPMCVATYTLSRTLPESYKNTLPEVEDIEANLNGPESEE